jgi:hypothetical protein
MHDLTLADYQVRHQVKQYRGARSIPIDYRMQSFVMLIQLWRYH